MKAILTGRSTQRCNLNARNDSNERTSSIFGSNRSKIQVKMQFSDFKMVRNYSETPSNKNEPYRFRGFQKNENSSTEPVKTSIPKKENLWKGKEIEFETVRAENSSVRVKKPVNTSDKFFEYCVHNFNWDNKEFYLLGIVPSAIESLNHAERLMDSVRPDVVLIQADPRRSKNYGFGRETEEYKDLPEVGSVVNALQKNNAILAYFYLSGFLDRFKTGMTSPVLCHIGRAAESRNIPNYACDRPPEISWIRWWSLRSLFEKATLSIQIYLGMQNSSISDNAEVALESFDLETIRNINEQVKGINNQDPASQLIHGFERSLHFAQKMKDADGKKVLAVAGMDETHAILRAFNEDIHYQELQTFNDGIEESIRLWEKLYGPPNK